VAGKVPSSKDWSGDGRLLVIGVGSVGLESLAEAPLGCDISFLTVEGAGESFLFEDGVRKKLATCGLLPPETSSTSASQLESMWPFMFACLTGLPHIGQLTMP